MTNRFQTVMNDLELAAKKLEISIEDAVAILLGKHPTHQVTTKPLPSVNTENATVTPAKPTPGEGGTLANPISSTAADASVAAQNQQAAGSTESSGANED